MNRAFFAASAIIFSALLFLFPHLSSEGAANGIALCIDVLLPSLFPFMILSCLITLCGAGDILSFIFLPITKLLHIPSKISSVWLAAFIGGFPSGAHTICSLYRMNAVEKQQAERLISCCVCSGPAFLILAVGRNMLGSAQIGTLLFCAQILSVILLTAIFCRSDKSEHITAPHRFQRFDSALVSSVSSSANAMLNIFAFVIFFSIVTSLLKDTHTVSMLILPFLEVTLGCSQAALLKGGLSMPLIAFLNGFGGFSVCFQILSLANNDGLNPAMFWRIRFFNGILCAIIAKLLVLLFPVCTPVFSSTSDAAPILIWSVDRMLGGICLASMLVMTMQKLDFLHKS